MRNLRFRIFFPALLAVLFLAGLWGCDFFSSSDNSFRVSPFIRDLRLSRISVLCDQDFTISFQYEDLQGDIEVMRLSFHHTTESGASIEVDVPWEDEGDLDLSGDGLAIYTYRFFCGSGYPRGTYVVQVVVEDAKGHESNTRSSTIDLRTS